MALTTPDFDAAAITALEGGVDDVTGILVGTIGTNFDVLFILLAGSVVVGFLYMVARGVFRIGRG